MGGYAPRAREEIVRPRLQLGASGRTVNSSPLGGLRNAPSVLHVHAR